MRDVNIRKGARAIADALQGPCGQIKFAKVAVRHLGWFETARADLSWDQIIKVLAAAGAKRENGLPFTRGHVSSAVWRAQKRVGVQSRAHPTEHVPAKMPKKVTRVSRPMSNHGKRHDRAGMGPAVKKIRTPVDTNEGSSLASKGTEGRRAAASADVLGFMQRAAKMRRPSD